ncbi:uncharacterized protein LOC103949057 [Pyrus x bretschneideri]|uniref:uncharacterized protein LOC103949057 n=1 Tax=Pyrus x bretschneideri TaxID=225117 RepID=UPI00202ECDA0|nr:uncharacterized protein LOC103949057 [Pyrus x bretschneideri]
MKKMKGVVSDAMEDQRNRFKHQSLMQDYEELQKDADATKKKLQIMKQKKSMLVAEVRFLRRRYKYLIGNPSMNPRPKQDVVQTHNLESQRVTYLKGKSSSKKESASRYPLPALDLNKKEKVKHGMEDIVQKPPPKFGLNLNARALGGKEATLRTPTPNLTREDEEEFQANYEPMRIKEPNKSLRRVGNDEQHNDMKLLACRTIGNGSNRSGKRKITWQDQVALRV